MRWILDSMGATAIVTLLSATVYADEYSISTSTSLGLVKEVELIVDDQVTGGCWTNLSLSKQKIRLLLEQSGIPVHDRDIINAPFFPILSFRALGFKHGAVCFAHLEFVVGYGIFKSWDNVDSANVYHIGGFLDVWRKGRIISSSSDLNEQITEFAEEAAAELSANIIAQGRDNSVQIMLLDWENLKPMTMEEFEEQFDQSASNSQ